MKWIKYVCVISFVSNFLMPINTVKRAELSQASSTPSNETIEKQVEYEIKWLINDSVKKLLKTNENEILVTKKEGERIDLAEIKALFLDSSDYKRIGFKEKGQSELSAERLSEVIFDENKTYELVLLEDKREMTTESVTLDSTTKGSQSDISSTEEGNVAVSETPVPNQRIIPAIPTPNKILPLNKVFNQAVGYGPSVIQEGEVLQITSNYRQLGAIWSKQQLNLEKDFKLKSWIYLGNSFRNAADGITFTLHNDSRGIHAIGSNGSGIGAYSTRNSNTFIDKAVSFEFDTFFNNNTYPQDNMDKYLSEELVGHRGHVAFTTPARDSHIFKLGNHQLARFPQNVLSDGKWHQFEVEWDSQTHVLSVSLPDLALTLIEGGAPDPNSKVLKYNLSDYKTRFGGSYVYWGFTGSTGEKMAENAIAMSSVPNSVSHVATLKHAADSMYVTEIDAQKDDVIDINDHLILDDKYSKFNADAEIQVDLKDLSYQADTLLIDGHQVPSENISFSGDTMIVKLGELASKMNKVADLKMKATVTTDKVKESRVYRFIYIDDGIVSDSSEIKINLIEKKVEPTNYALLSQIKKKEDQTFQPFISAHKGEEVIIKDFIAITDDATVFRKDGKLSTTLTHLDTEQLEVSLNDVILNSDAYIVEEGDKLVISLADETLLADLNSHKYLSLQIKTRIKETSDVDQLSYHFDYETKGFKKSSNDVTIDIKKDMLTLLEVPSEFNFGQHAIDSKNHEYWSAVTGNLIIKEDRPSGAEKWKLTVSESKPLTHQENTQKSLEGLMRWNDKTQKIATPITHAETIITEHKHSGNYIVNEDWAKDEKGISIFIPWDKQTLGVYRGKLEWRLKNTP